MLASEAQFLLHFFLPRLRDELRITGCVLRAVPEDKRDYRPDARARSAVELAWHIASAETWFLDAICQGQFGGEEPRMPTCIKSIADIAAWYQKTVPPLLDQVAALTPEQLAGPIPFLGVMNDAAVSYLSLHLVHTAHHRGQLAAYLRAVGARVPFICGGSADEPFLPPQGA
jgi:uncharacterized damage-inducible protein DinB